ncbi:MAG: rane protein [Subtercola sp.]|nr:rane protein [Subtercola sp.]
MERSGDSSVRRGLEPTFRVATAGRTVGFTGMSATLHAPRRAFGLAFATVFALVVVIVLGMPGSPSARADTTPAPTSPAASGSPDSSAGSLTMALAPDNAGVLAAGQDLGLTVSIANTTDQTVPATTVHVWLDRTQLATRAALTAWLAAGGAAGGDSTGSASPGTGTPTPSASSSAAPAQSAAPTQNPNSLAVDVTSPAIAPNTTATLRTSLPAAALGLTAWGAYGLGATATAATIDGATGSTSASTLAATSVVTWSVGAPATGATLGIIMPLTVSPGDAGLLTAPELAAATAPGGVLTTKLDSVIGLPVTLAIDPMIIVSIRVLGTAAPQSALDWLADLAAAANPTFPLSYADSDLVVQKQAGAPAVLAPTSFDYALVQSNFQALPSPDPFALPGQVATPAVGTGASSSAPSAPTGAATPSPTPTPAAGSLPTFTDLTTWNYTRTDIAWPASGTVSSSDLDYFAASGLTTSILSSDNVTLPDAGVTPNAPVTLGDKSAVIADAELSDALQSAVTAVTEPPRDAALAEVAAELAIITAQAGSGTPALVASLGRAAPSSAFAVTRSLDLTEQLPWAAEAPISTVLGAPQTAGVTLVDSPEAADRVTAVSSMLEYERQVSAFAPVIDKPELITGKQRANLLAVLAQSWLGDSDGFAAAVQTNNKASTTTLSSVQIVDGSTVNLLATNGDVPVPISNDLDQAVTVTLRVTPSNGRLVVDPNNIDVTIEAHSQKTAKVPVKAAVATGQVDLGLELYNKTGVLVSRAAPLEINVSADWEGIGTLSIAILAVLLLAFGVVRLVLKRRRAKRAAAAGGDADGDLDGAGPGGAVPGGNVDAAPDLGAPNPPPPAEPGAAATPEPSPGAAATPEPSPGAAATPEPSAEHPNPDDPEGRDG